MDTEALFAAADSVAWGISFVGIAVLVWGVLVALVELVRLEAHLVRGVGIAHDRAVVRQDLGHHILFGLEFMIAADVIKTVVNPALEQLGILGAIVVIRTVISHFLIIEMRQAGRLDDWDDKKNDPHADNSDSGEATG